MVQHLRENHRCYFIRLPSCILFEHLRINNTRTGASNCRKQSVRSSVGERLCIGSMFLRAEARRDLLTWARKSPGHLPGTAVRITSGLKSDPHPSPRRLLSRIVCSEKHLTSKTNCNIKGTKTGTIWKLNKEMGEKEQEEMVHEKCLEDKHGLCKKG